MKLLPSFQLVAIASGIAMLGGLGGGWWLGSARWEARYNELKAEGWQVKAGREKTVREAVERNLKTLQSTLEHNAKVTHDLQQKNVSTVAERDRFRVALDRVRAEEARSGTRSCPVPEADDRPHAPPAREAGGLTECQGLLIEVLAEGTDNADRLDSLNAELEPQLAPADIF